MKAPDIIYVDDLAVVNDCVTKISLKQLPNFSEYIRKDALLEWLKMAVESYSHPDTVNVVDTIRCEGKLLGWKDLKSYSLPFALDKAAEKYAFINWEDNDYHEGASEGVPFDPIGYTEKVFKAGAKWMSNQQK